MASGRRAGWLGVVGVILCASLLGGCSKDKTDSGSIKFVNVEQAAELSRGKDQLLGIGGKKVGVWVDCRTAQEYRDGHIPGAISLPYERLNTEHTRLKGYDCMIVYGNDYGDRKAEGMSKRLIEFKYKDVKTLTGGLRAWQTAGNEVAKGDE